MLFRLTVQPPARHNMSRALDESTAASLGKGDALAAYKAISEALHPPATGELLEIEVLPKSHQLGPGEYLLRDGPAIAVSKLGLVQAFLVAREILKGHAGKSRPQTEEALLASTAIILLLDPEYITAANTRKRLLLQAHEADAGNMSRRISEERGVVDSLLTSRLHRHTKSPTLWGHRRWLVELSVRLGMATDVPGDMLNIIMVSGERHPRNYYAWLHARFLVGLPNTGVEALDNTVIPGVKDWCLRHHTDISGWSFLLYLLQLRGRATERATCSIFADVLNLVTSLRWMNESIWVFLRTLAASGLVGEVERAEFLKTRETLLHAAKETAQKQVLEASLGWYETYRIQP